MNKSVQTGRTIYYALAILHYLRHSGNQCLLEDVIEDFKTKDEDEIFPEYLLTDRTELYRAVDILQRAGAVEVDEDEYAPPLLGPKRNLEEIVDRFDSSDMATINRFLKAGQLVGAFRKLGSEPPDQDRQQIDDRSRVRRNEESDIWEPLPVDRTDPKYPEAIEKAERALELLEQENGYAATNPEEKKGIVETIRGNLNALKEGFPSRTSVIEGLVKPLKFIANKFGENIVGAAATAAIKALCSYLGISL